LDITKQMLFRHARGKLHFYIWKYYLSQTLDFLNFDYSVNS